MFVSTDLGGLQKDIITKAPLSSLKLALISQLEFGTNRGCYLKLKITQVYQLAAIQMFCKDQKGTQILVSVYNFPFYGKSYSDYFYVDRIMFVKEPFKKISLDGRENIRVDDHSDVKFEKAEKKQPQTYKLEGKNYVQKKNYIQAYCHYEQALRNCSDKAYKVTFLMNKALMCAKLNLKQQYQENVKKVLQIDPNNQKAHYHLIKSEAISMKNMCSDKFTALVKKVHEDNAINQNHKQQLIQFVQLQRSFQKNQNIDWLKAITSSTIGEYFNPKLARGKGNYKPGLFATQNIKQGQILMIETPLCSFQYRVLEEQQQDPLRSQFMVNLVTSLRTKIFPLFKYSRQFRAKMLSISSSQLLNQSILEDSEINSMDLHNIISEDAFEDFQLKAVFIRQKQSDQGPLFYQIYQKCCLIKHKCEANSYKINIGSSQIIYAVDQIKKGEQIFINFSKQKDYEKRKLFMRKWSISCNCILCNKQVAQSAKDKTPNWKNKQFEAKRLLENPNQIKSYTQEDLLSKLCWLQFAAELYHLHIHNELADKIVMKIFTLSQKQLLELKHKIK